MSINTPKERFATPNTPVAMPGMEHPVFRLRPGNRLKELAANPEDAGLGAVFSYPQIAPWFVDMKPSAVMVLLNRYARRGDPIEPLCHGIYRFTKPALTREQTLLNIPALARPAGSFYLTLHSAMDVHFRRNVHPVIVAMTSGRTSVIPVANLGYLIFKTTKLALPQRLKECTYSKRYGYFRASPDLAMEDERRYRAGFDKLMSRYNVGYDLPPTNPDNV